MKKNFKTYTLALLVVLATIAILDNLRISDLVEEMQEDKDKLADKVASLEKKLGISSNTSDELEKENKRLVESLFQLEEEVDALKSTVEYQDFIDATSTIESYMAMETFKETWGFIALKNGTSFSMRDSVGNCPCSFAFYGKSFEWVPNTVLTLKEFRIEKEKILLTYNTVADIKHNYQFVMTKAAGRNDKVERWRIEEIKLKVKGN
ncbi:hypothetical protein FSZ17_05470 [Cytobacillus dafuensis]|uniref:Uncharacterized protein n=1 Tax=Cytobacillus dafuensis TaxID=1742359 RepID=A0A5B8ZAP9_CYTDA|nr:hypothetical protein FSZ17_05470 [Cytobacillus dafuensis]